MARRHWLDPLARRVLIATGHIPPASALASRRAALAEAARQAAHDAAVDQELLLLKGACASGLVDVNRATASDWRQLPGCTAEQADLLLRLQAGGVQLSGPDDLQRLLRLEAETLRAWIPRLVFHWYGEPAPLPIDLVAINQAGAAELRERLSLTPERLRRLQQERARAPFRDLADLQARLGLPAPLVEAWIGRLSFDPPAPPAEPPPPARSEATPRGPSLPPTRRRSSPAPQPGRTP
jgi:DNA uptake protein ComE-like DNA-binding protein